MCVFEGTLLLNWCLLAWKDSGIWGMSDSRTFTGINALTSSGSGTWSGSGSRLSTIGRLLFLFGCCLECWTHHSSYCCSGFFQNSAADCVADCKQRFEFFHTAVLCTDRFIDFFWCKLHSALIKFLLYHRFYCADSCFGSLISQLYCYKHRTISSLLFFSTLCLGATVWTVRLWVWVVGGCWNKLLAGWIQVSCLCTLH